MDLQPLVLRALLQKDVWESMGKLVTQDVINDPSYKRLLTIMADLHKTTTHDLSLSAVVVAVTTAYSRDESLRDDVMERIALVEKAAVLPADQLEEVVRRYLAKEGLTKAMNWAISHMNDDNPDLEEFVEMAQRARDVSLSVDTDVATYSNYAEPSSDVRKGIVPLNFNSELNTALGGGIAKGELTIILGAGGRGKTSHMAKIALDGTKLGLNSVVVSMEINEGKYMMTFDRCLCGMTKEELLANPFAAIQRRERHMIGDIFMKDWSHQPVTVSDLEALMDSLIRKGKRIDILVVDYLMIMKPRTFHREERNGYKEIAEDLRRLANKYNVAVVTGWQANREGSQAELLTEKHIGEDYRAMWTADTIITLNQSPEENRNKRMRYGILKQREGTDRSAYSSYCDLERCLMRDETVEDLANKFNLEVQNVRGETDGVEDEDTGSASGRDASAEPRRAGGAD